MSSLPTAPAWRNFPFFDAAPVKDVHDLDAPPEIFKTTPEISTILPSSAGVLIADIYGTVHILNRDFEAQRSWIAYEGGRVTHMAEQRGVLVTLGEDESARAPVLKIWDLEKKAPAPPLLRSTKMQLTKPHPVCTIALSANLSHLAVGFADGTVLLYRHIDQSINNNTALLKPRTVHESPTEPITGLGFSESKSLFVVTTNRVLSYQVSGSGSGSGKATVVDDVGCGLGCAAMDWRGHDVVVAREEAIYVCGVESRGACYAYEGHKSFVRSHLNYLVIVSPPITPTASAAYRTVRNFAARNPTETDITKVAVFDPENKIVGYSGTFTQGVRDIISIPEWGGVYILGNDGTLVQLLEKPFSAKLDMLYRSSMYPVALNLAKTQGLEDSSESVADIHKQYGDHLYNKGNWDGAMGQFVKTIGWVAPSYVIRKFLDAQRIHNLVTYLQELHSLGLANSDHTTLLLNAYTKLKDVARLDGFIKTESRRVSSGSGEKDELPFDLDTAIRVCRQAGYFSHASYLAKKYERHEEYLRIQIEDARNYSEALVYLRALGGDAAESNLARYGRAMLDSLPEETTQLLIDLCTSTGPLLEPEEEMPNTAASTKALFSAGTTAPSYLSYLALNRNSAALDAAPPPSPSIKTVKAGDTASRRGSIHESPPQTPDLHIGAPHKRLPPIPLKAPPKLLSPRIYFAHFVDHMDQFIIFLETVAQRRWGQSVDSIDDLSVAPESEPFPDEHDRPDQVAVWNTLLELYLTLPDQASVGGASREDDEGPLRRKALRVLKSTTLPYDPTHALILCSSRGYTRGLVLLWERMSMYEDVLRFWMDSGEPNASDEVVRRLVAYGAARPQLYLVVLRYLTSTPALLSRHEADVRSVLEHIDQEGIATPLGIIQVLARNDVASVGLVKEWLMTRIQTARSEIQADQEWTTSYRLETAAKLKQVEDLADPEHPRVFNVTRCSGCGGQLDLPSVHFMCNHSFHQPRCIQENETECPNCVREHGVIREIRRNHERLADQHDLFVSEVKEGGFSAVASAFSRGILNMSRLEEVGV
ncbi:hypothetical protein C8R43DRAFT_338381 [Mycena crocata]|nr:hypothetical protein C8R43DRAFT_338381 [Mycena crocata]